MVSCANHQGLVTYLIELFKSLNCKIYAQNKGFSIYKVFFIVSLLFSGFVYSDDSLIIPMDISHWKYEGTKFECNLIQLNESYGKFYFQSEVRSEVNFVSDIQYKSKKWQKVALEGSNAPWDGELQRKVFGVLNVNQPSHRFVFDKGADSLLESMSLGRWVRLSLGRPAVPSEIVIPTILIQEPLASFNACRARLPKLTFSQARDLVFSFKFGQKKLSVAQRELIDALYSYVAVDDRVTKILIDGHTDNVGSRFANLSVSRTRAQQVADTLVAFGVDKSMIEVRAHGSRYPIASNESEKGQAKNRRVTLRLVRDNEQTLVKSDAYEQQTQQMKVKVQ